MRKKVSQVSACTVKDGHEQETSRNKNGGKRLSLLNLSGEPKNKYLTQQRRKQKLSCRYCFGVAKRASPLHPLRVLLRSSQPDQEK